MGRLLDQLHEDTHAWAAKGHKANRARQRRMMMGSLQDSDCKVR